MIVRVVPLVVILCIIIYFHGKVNAQLSPDLFVDPRIIVKSRTYFTDGFRGPISYGASQGPELVSANGQVTGNRKLDIYIRHKPGYITGGIPGMYGQISASKGPIINLGNKPGYYAYGSSPGLGMAALGEFSAMAMPIEISGRGRGILDTLPSVAPWLAGQPRPLISSLLYGGADILPTTGQLGVNGRPGVNLGTRPGYNSGGLENDFTDTLGEISPTFSAKLGGLDAFSSAMPWLANQPRSTLAPSVYGSPEMYSINGQVGANRFPHANLGIKPYSYGGPTSLGLTDPLSSYAPLAISVSRHGMLPYGGSEIYPQTGLTSPNRGSFVNPSNRLSFYPGSETYGPYVQPNLNRGLPTSPQYLGNRPVAFGNPHGLYSPGGLEFNPTNSSINIPGQLNPYTGLNNYYAPGSEIPNLFGGNPSFYTPSGTGMYPHTNPYNPSVYGSEIPSIINGQINPYSGHNNIGMNPGIYPGGGSEMYPTINPLNLNGLLDFDRNRPGCHMARVPETYTMNGQTYPHPYIGLNNILGQIPRYYGTGCPKSYDTNGPIIPSRGLNTNFGNMPGMYGNAGLETYLPNDSVNMNVNYNVLGVNNNNRPGYSSNSGLDIFPTRPIYGSMSTSHNTGYGSDTYGSKLSGLSRLLQNYDGSGPGLLNGNERYVNIKCNT